MDGDLAVLRLRGGAQRAVRVGARIGDTIEGDAPAIGLGDLDETAEVVQHRLITHPPARACKTVVAAHGVVVATELQPQHAGQRGQSPGLHRPFRAIFGFHLPAGHPSAHHGHHGRLFKLFLPGFLASQTASPARKTGQQKTIGQGEFLVNESGASTVRAISFNSVRLAGPMHPMPMPESQTCGAKRNAKPMDRQKTRTGRVARAVSIQRNRARGTAATRYTHHTRAVMPRKSISEDVHDVGVL